MSGLVEEERHPVQDVIQSGGGRPLDPPVKQLMESRLGHEFGDVKLHTDAKATESAKAVQAQAYTVGNDVVFQNHNYAPESPTGMRMLAHELTHVVQQRSGPVEGTPAPGGIQISHPSDRFEQAADQAADRAMSSRGETAGPQAIPSLQREPEEGADGPFIQRQTPEEELKEEEAPPPG